MIPGLQASAVPPRTELAAIDRAFILIDGRNAKGDSALRKALEDLKATAEHNQEVYDKASAALNELNRRERDVVKRESEAEDKMRQANARSAAAARDAEQREQQLSVSESRLKREQAAFEGVARKEREQLDARAKALDKREKEATRLEDGAKARAVEADQRLTKAAERETAVRSVVDEIKRVAAHL